ncbi:MAG: hypothetical protein KC417_15615, partial [Myxococcales bacterium]|nr:hypothetical protein [Myxococcales bacterium]
SEWAPTSLFVHVGKLSLNAAPMGQSAKSPIRVVVPQATVVLPGASAVRVDVGTGGEGTLEVSGGSAWVWGTVEGGVSDALFIAVAGETWNFGTALERRTPKGGPRHAVVPAFGEAGLAAAISALERELAAEAELTARIDAIGEAQRRREARTPEESADLRRKLVEAVTARRGGQKRLLAAWEHAYLAASMQGPSAAEPRTKVATLGEANRGALRIAAVEPL